MHSSFAVWDRELPLVFVEFDGLASYESIMIQFDPIFGEGDGRYLSELLYAPSRRTIRISEEAMWELNQS